MVTDAYLSLELLEDEVLTPIKIWQNPVTSTESDCSICNHTYNHTYTWKLPLLAYTVERNGSGAKSHPKSAASFFLASIVILSMSLPLNRTHIFFTYITSSN